MNSRSSRREMLGKLAGPLTAFAVAGVTRQACAASAPDAAKGYDPQDHQWLMAIDVNRCIGCGLCVEACKTENHVPEGPCYFRTWVERYVVTQPPAGSARSRGEVLVFSPNGGMRRPGETAVKDPPPDLPAKENIQHSFFVPKLCNLCHHSPCAQVCPVGATFDSPDGAVLVDPKYCIGCGFCIQACPYGCRFLNPITRTAEKCTLCYHRITRGLKPACVEVCPTQARIFGDMKHAAADAPIRQFFQNNRVQSLKPHLGTEPRVLYAGLDKEVR
jgi:tetrathionate reductase subunit B